MSCRSLVPFLFALAACGANGADVESFIDQQAAAQCGWEFRCCTDAEIKLKDGMKFASEADCKPYAALALEESLYLERLAAREGRIRLDHQQADACIAQLQARVCNPKPGQPVPPVDPNAADPCAQLWIGSTPIGQACIYANECEKGAHCVEDASVPGRGVCVPYQKEADICNASSDCDPTSKTLYCAKLDYHCRKFGQLGEACAYSVSGGQPSLPMLLQCDKSLYCDSSTSKCTAYPKDGQRCLNPTPPGVSNECDPTPSLQLSCGGDGVCHGPMALPGRGQECPNHVCQAAFYCAYQTGTGTYVCVDKLDYNQACTTTSTPCKPELYCDRNATGVCQYKLDDGQPCQSYDQCKSSSCNAGPTGQRVCGVSTSTIQCVGR